MIKTTALLGALLLSGASAVSAAEWQTLPDRAPEPADNPTTPAKVALGKIRQWRGVLQFLPERHGRW